MSIQDAPQTSGAESPSLLLCPHCLAPTGADDPAPAMRCATCRLVVGPGRAVTASHATRSGRTAGAAAGTLSAKARREAGTTEVDADDVSRDLHRVAAQVGVATDRLRMLDYQNAWVSEPSLSSLSQIMTAFGSWKAARQAVRHDVPEAGA